MLIKMLLYYKTIYISLLHFTKKDSSKFIVSGIQIMHFAQF
jgi:hypothetical protein